MNRHVLALLVVLGGCLAFQAWFLGLSPHGTKLGDAVLCNDYTEALAHGQAYLLVKPDPRLVAAKDPFGPATAGLLLYDTSFYHGRYYMYFGIVPFVTFLVPWRLLTGAPPSPELAILVFCALGYAAYGLVLLRAIQRWFGGASACISAIAFLSLILASGTWPLMGRPAVYEIENAAAYAFFALALWALARFEWSEDRPGWALAGAAAAGSLVLGCRPNYFPAFALLQAWLLYRAGRRNLLCVAVPVTVVGLALAGWNFHRFGNPIDFGLKHTVSEDPAKVRPLSTAANLPYHLHRYALGQPLLERYFPFIQGQKEAAFPLGPQQEVSNQVYGFLLLCPVLLCASAAFIRRRSSPDLLPYGWIALAAFAGNYLFLSSVTMSCYRYPADFLGPLALLAAVGTLVLAGRSGWIRWSALAGVTLATVWSAIAVTSETFSIAQITELFDERRPQDFRAASRWFNLPVYRRESTRPPNTKVTITLRLPTNRYGQSEPLLVDGANGAQDFVYLYYQGPGLLQIGFEASGYGGPLSPSLAIDYGRAHQITIVEGSLFPPDDHPMFAGWDPAAIAAKKSDLTISVDGVTALQRHVKFHPPRGQIYVGLSPFDPAFGARFTGKIEASN